MKGFLQVPLDDSSMLPTNDCCREFEEAIRREIDRVTDPSIIWYPEETCAKRDVAVQAPAGATLRPSTETDGAGGAGENHEGHEFHEVQQVHQVQEFVAGAADEADTAEEVHEWDGVAEGEEGVELGEADEGDEVHAVHAVRACVQVDRDQEDPDVEADDGGDGVKGP